MEEIPAEGAHGPQHNERIILDVEPMADRLKDEIQWDIQRMQGIREARSREGPSIWRVSPSMREQESEAYEPTFISIGPLHRSNERLWLRKDLKLKYLNDLLSRSPGNDLRNYIRVIYSCEPRARTQYGDKVKLGVDEFVQMLVVDGCFIIEFVHKYAFVERQGMAGEMWDLLQVRRDLMLLENQIPFFVLVELFNQCTIPVPHWRNKPLTLMDAALDFLQVTLPREHHPMEDEVLHLLHLYHLCLDPNRTSEESRPHSFGQLVSYPPLKKATGFISVAFLSLLYLVFTGKVALDRMNLGPEAWEMIPCATELREVAGIKFKKKVPVDSYLKVSFREGTLEIPYLRVSQSTISQLRNFIALEDCCHQEQVKKYFTSYAYFMDCIIDTKDDVAILRKHGIIESRAYSNEEVAKMFNTLCKGTTAGYFDYNAKLFHDVREYCLLPHHRLGATIAGWTDILIGKYFNNPWTFISLLAAIVLLALTATQTYFTVYPKKQT